MNRTKLGYLSLSFVIGDSSYWMTTGCGRAGWSFMVIPVVAFGDHVLMPDHSSSKTSEITVFDTGCVFSSMADIDPTDLALNVADYPSISWNEMIGVCLDKTVPLDLMTDLFHHHIVRKVRADLKIADVDYEVTAFLLPPMGKFAVYGSDYVPGTNPNWITFDLPDDDSFRARLREFRVVAVRLGGGFYAV